MKFLTFLVAGVACCPGVATAEITAFTYQGILTANSAAANGSYDLRFELFSTSAGSTSVSSPLTNRPVSVSNGLFVVTLDFGMNVFTGSVRYLELGVRPFGDTNQYTYLSPRQAITAAPYAVHSASAFGVIGPLIATNLTGTIDDSRLSTNVALQSLGANFAGSLVATQFVGNGYGLTNVPGAFFWTAVESNFVSAFPNTGYLATNDAVPLTVMLPPGGRIGDTFRVAGVGAAGWIIAQAANQSILAGNLSASIGAGWTPRDSARNWQALASSASGDRLAAAVNVGLIYTSTNAGVNWTAQGNSGNRAWSGVASSLDGVKLVAVVDGGLIYTSTTSGQSWASRAASRNWKGVASSSDGVKLVAAPNGANLYTSPDSGANWFPRDSVRSWRAVASSKDGTNLVAVANPGQIYTSTNSGVNWTARATSLNWTAVACSGDGRLMVAVASLNQIFVSADFGVSWGPISSTDFLLWSGVASSDDGSKLLAVYGDNSNAGDIYVSTDFGASWLKRTSLNLNNWSAAAVSADGTKMVAAVKGGNIYTSSQSTTTLGTAGYLSGAQQSAITIIYVGNNRFMALNHIGAVVPH